MANVLHRTTMEFRPSVNTPDYDPADWLISPDLTIVRTVPRKYWTIQGDTLVEMDATQKAAVDAAELVSHKTAKLDTLRDGMMRRLAENDATYQTAKIEVEAATDTATVDAVRLA